MPDFFSGRRRFAKLCGVLFFARIPERNFTDGNGDFYPFAKPNKPTDYTFLDIRFFAEIMSTALAKLPRDAICIRKESSLKNTIMKERTK